MDQEEYQAQELIIARNQAFLARERAEAEEKAQKEQHEKDKMGWGVFIFALVLSIIADIVEIVTLGTIGWLVGLVIDFILFITFGMTRAGQKQWKKLVGALVAESIPGINILPVRSIMVIWSFIASRPKLIGKLDKVLKVASKIPSPIAAQLKLASKAVSMASAAEQGDIKGALRAATAFKGTNKPSAKAGTVGADIEAKEAA
ncbi:MAG: hypothetical protein Q7S32_03500 [bacterium]|nr:hypothetical protein [bacterium]